MNGRSNSVQGRWPKWCFELSSDACESHYATSSSTSSVFMCKLEGGKCTGQEIGRCGYPPPPPPGLPKHAVLESEPVKPGPGGHRTLNVRR